MSKINDFPYPVLKYGYDSGYVDNIRFQIKDNQPEFVNDRFKIKFEIENNSTTINELINNDTVSYYITYTTKNVSKTLICSNIYELEIPLCDLESEDSIKVLVHIIAEKDFELFWNEEIEEKFNLGEMYQIKRKDIVGISNYIIFSYNTTGDTIIKLITVKDKDFKGMKINMENEFIYVNVNEEFNKNYQIIANKDNKLYVKDILNSSIIYLILVYVFTKVMIEKNFNSYKQFRWYNIINNTFLSKDINFEKEILEMDDEDMDMDKIYSLVEIFMNNSYEESIIRTGERVMKNAD